MCVRVCVCVCVCFCLYLTEAHEGLWAPHSTQREFPGRALMALSRRAVSGDAIRAHLPFEEETREKRE